MAHRTTKLSPLRRHPFVRNGVHRRSAGVALRRSAGGSGPGCTDGAGWRFAAGCRPAQPVRNSAARNIAARPSSREPFATLARMAGRPRARTGSVVGVADEPQLALVTDWTRAHPLGILRRRRSPRHAGFELRGKLIEFAGNIAQKRSRYAARFPALFLRPHKRRRRSISASMRRPISSNLSMFT